MVGVPWPNHHVQISQTSKQVVVQCGGLTSNHKSTTNRVCPTQTCGESLSTKIKIHFVLSHTHNVRADWHMWYVRSGQPRTDSHVCVRDWFSFHFSKPRNDINTHFSEPSFSPLTFPISREIEYGSGDYTWNTYSIYTQEFLSDTANRRQGFTGTLSDVPSPTDFTVDNQDPLFIMNR